MLHYWTKCPVNVSRPWKTSEYASFREMCNIYIYKYTCTLDLSVAENIEAMSLEIGISEDECTS